LILLFERCRDWEERSTVGEIQLAQMTMPQDDIECLCMAMTAMINLLMSM